MEVGQGSNWGCSAKGNNKEIFRFSLYGSVVLLCLGHFFSFLILYTVCRTPMTRYHPNARPLPTNRTTQTQNKRTQTSMPRVGFERTIPVFKRAKTVNALHRAVTVIVTRPFNHINYSFLSFPLSELFNDVYLTFFSPKYGTASVHRPSPDSSECPNSTLVGNSFSLISCTTIDVPNYGPQTL
jgi:hypothetical protein